MENTALAVDPFEAAMANLHAAGIDFEIVEDDPDPPDKTEPPPGKEGGSQEGAANASPETVTEPSDTSRRVPVSEWRTALMNAEELTHAEWSVGMALAYHLSQDGSQGDHHVKQKTLARWSRMNEDTVSKACASLEAKGYLVREKAWKMWRYWAVVPDGAEVIRFQPLETGVTGSRSAPRNRGDQPLETGVTREQVVIEQVVSAAPSLTEDQELYPAMLTLADNTPGVRSPKSWVQGVYAEDIAPIIEAQGRNAALAEIQRRTIEARRQQKRRTHHRPPESDHGSEVTATEHW